MASRLSSGVLRVLLELRHRRLEAGDLLVESRLDLRIARRAALDLERLGRRFRRSSSAPSSPGRNCRGPTTRYSARSRDVRRSSPRLPPAPGTARGSRSAARPFCRPIRRRLQAVRPCRSFARCAPRRERDLCTFAKSLKSRSQPSRAAGSPLADLAGGRGMQRLGEIDRLGFGEAPPSFEPRDVAAEPGDGGAQRLVAVGARADAAFASAPSRSARRAQLAAVLEHRLLARRLAAGEPRLGVGERGLEPVASAAARSAGAVAALSASAKRTSSAASRVSSVGDLGAALFGQRLAVVELRFDAMALASRSASANCAAPSAPRNSSASRRAASRSLTPVAVASCNASNLTVSRLASTLLAAAASSAARSRRSSRTISIACWARKRVAIGDRLGFAQRREQARARFGEPTSAARRRPAPRPTPKASRSGNPMAAKIACSIKFVSLAGRTGAQYRTPTPIKQRG